jgi:aryl-alcohol dehydrogenase-like predicted oxidoreductase
MEARRLGRTDHHSSVAVLGAAAFARSNPEETEQVFDAALAAGVNHLDIAPRYGDAERLVGPLIPAVRARLFVGCKTTRRNGDGARAQLEESLTKLGCDAFDLYQMHAVTTVDELDERAPAAEAILRARDEGLCRFVGVTGHDMGAPRAHAEAVRRWDLDTVMFPVNPRLWADPDYRRDAEALLELAAERDLGVMAIKAAAARPWPGGTDAGDRHSTTWYEPYTTADEVARGVGFARSTPGVHPVSPPGDRHGQGAPRGGAHSDTPMTADERPRAGAPGFVSFHENGG